MLNNEFDRAVKFFLSKRGYAHILSMNQLIFVFFLIFLTSNSVQQLGPDLAFGFVSKISGYEIRDFIDLYGEGGGGGLLSHAVQQGCLRSVSQ